MKDENRAKSELIRELKSLRRQVKRITFADRERKQTEEALRESEEKYRNLVESAHDGITIIQDGIAKYANPAIAEMWGGTVEEIIDTPFTDYVHPDELPKMVERYRRRMVGKDVEQVYETVLRRKDGSKVYAELKGGVITFHGKPADLIVIRDITERKQMEVSLRESEEKYRKFFEDDLSGDYISTPQGKILDCNQAFTKMLGFRSIEAVLNSNAETFYTQPTDRQDFLDRLRREKKLFNYEEVLKRRDGQSITVLENVIGRFDSQGELISFQGYIFDITARKRAEKQIMMLAQAVRSINECVSITDENNNIIFVNPAFLNTYGYTEQDLMEKNISLVRSSKVSDEESEKILQLTMEGGWHGELMNKRKDGSEFPISLSSTVIRDNEGKPIALIGVATDITERKRVENELYQSRQMLQLILDNIPQCVFWKDRDSNYLGCNRAFAEDAGLEKSEEMKGKTDFDLPWNDRADLYRQDDVLVMNTDASKMNYEEPARGVDGIDFWVKTNKIPLHDPQGNVMGILCTYEDITERKRAEEALRLEKENFRRSLDESPLGVRIVSADGDTLYANRAILDFYGYDNLEELQKTPLKTRYTPESYAEFQKRKQQRERGDFSTSEYEISIVRKNDEVLHLQVHRKEVVWNNAQQFLVMYQDITERKLAEEALRESEEKHKALIETTDTGYLILDAQGRVIDANKEYIRLTGYDTLDEILGRSVVEWTAPHDLERNTIELKKCLEQGYIRNLEIDYINRSEQITPIEINATVVGGGESVRILSLCRDITERKQVEEALRYNEHKLAEVNRMLQLVMDTIPVRIFWKDKDSVFVGCNRLFAEDAGRKNPAELIGDTDFNMGWHEQAERYRNDDREVISSGKPKLAYEEPQTTPDGKQILLRTSKIPLYGIDNHIIGILGTYEDITERKQAEEKLSKSEEKYRGIFENVQDVYYEASIEGTILDLSPSIEIISKGQYHRDDLIGMSMYDFYSVVGRRQALLELLQEQGSVTDYEIMLKNRDGSQIPCSISAKIQFIAQGTQVKIIGSIRDITERKRAEEALRESEQLFRGLFNASPDAIVLIDPHNPTLWPIVDCNEAACKMNGYTREELIGQSIDVLNTIEGNPEERIAYLKNLRQKGIVHTEASHRHKDGHIFPVEVSTSIVTLGGHEMVLGIDRDITERKRAEEALHISEERYRRLFEEDLSGHFISTPEGKILACNSAFVKMFGFSSIEEALCENAVNLYKNEIDRNHFVQLIRDLKKVEHHEMELRRRDGKPIYVVRNAIGVFNEKGELTEIQGYIFDDTERRTLQRQFIQAQKLESIGVLAGGIAHDFNNILAIILGYSSLLEKRKLDDQKYAESIAAINKAVQRGAELVRQILTFARKTDVVFEPMNLTDIIRELLSMLRQTFPEIITFTEAIEKDLPYIQADRTQIHQVLLNLCVNARDAMPNGGSITIRTEKQTKEQIKERFPFADQYSYICLSVTDTGQGMDEGTRVKVFDPFFTTKAGGKGTGLGLSVVYGVMQTHKGFIDLESERGRGTTFRLYFPIPATNERAISSQQYSKSFEEGGTETILLVEDEDLLIEMMRSLLETKGYTVHIAHDGIEAIEVYKKHQQDISLVLTDMGLPVMTGMDEFKKLKEINPYVKVIFASGYFESDVKSELLKAGAKGFIQKPYTTGNVLQTLRHVLDGK